MVTLPQQTQSILIVDDTPANLSQLSEILTSAGYRTRPAQDGEMALKAVTAAPPDLILLDIKMPVMNGYEVCKRIKSNPNLKEIPIIFISALEDPTDKIRAFEAGAVDYLTRPFQREEVLVRVKNHLSLKQLQNSLKTAYQEMEERVELRTRELASANQALLQSEEALRESEEKYRTIFEHCGAPLMIIEEDTTISMINREFEKICGYSAPEVEGKMSWRQFLSDKGEIERLNEIHFKRRSFPLDVPQSYELQSINRRGEIKDLVVSVAMIPGTKKSLAAFLDITERKINEQRLRQASEELDRFFNLTIDLLCIATMDGSFLRLNQAWERTLGYSVKDLLSKRFFDLIHPDDLASTKAAVSELANGQQVINFVNRYRCKDGSYKWIEWRSTPQENLIYAAARDISDRVASENALRESEERFRSIIKSSPMGMYQYQLDKEDRLILIDYNNAATKYTKCDIAPYLGKPISEVFPLLEANGTASVYHQIALEGTNWEKIGLEYDDGNVKGVFDVYAFQTSPRRMAVVFTDAQERIRAAQEKAQLEHQLLQSQKMEAIGRLAGGIAHDFNNLLTVILGYTETLQKELEPKSILNSQVQQIAKAGEKASSLTKQLLAFSRKQVMQPTVFDLNTLVRDSSTMLARLIGEDVELIAELDPDLHKIKADLGQFEQILMNLVVNSRDAMPKGGKITIKTSNVSMSDDLSLHAASAKPGRYARLEIIDTGCGMSTETKSHLFEPFFTTKEKGKGTGLGLSTVYGIVQQSGGYISVESTLETGTTIGVYIPASSEADSKIQAPRQRIESSSGTETILVVEDEEMIRDLAKLTLQKYGYRVLEAKNGKEALEMYEDSTEPIHLLLTDIVMPYMSGIDLASRLCKTRASMKVILMSGYTDKSIVQQRIFEHTIEFLQKPFSPLDLVRKIRVILDS